MLERLARKIVLPPGKKKSYALSPPPPNKFGTYKYRERRIKTRYPFRYWLSNDVPDFFERRQRQWSDIQSWFRTRTIRRYHIVKTGLPPRYYDTDTIMLHACFQLLVDYVEIGLAHRNYEFEGKWVKGRCPEAGLAHLDWEIEDCPGHQGDNAQIQKDLYLWWTEYRPYRTEPFSDPGIWKEWRAKNERAEDDDLTDLMAKVGEPHHRAGSLDEYHTLEDQEMLVQLVKIRSSLWA